MNGRLHTHTAPSPACSAPSISKHRSAPFSRSRPSPAQHNPSSHSRQRTVAVAAAAAQPDRSGPVQPAAAGSERVQSYAELQQAGQQGEDSSWQPLIVQASKLPNQADQLWGDPSDRESRDVALVEPATRSYADLDYLSVSFRVLCVCWGNRWSTTNTAEALGRHTQAQHACMQQLSAAASFPLQAAASHHFVLLEQPAGAAGHPAE